MLLLWPCTNPSLLPSQEGLLFHLIHVSQYHLLAKAVTSKLHMTDTYNKNTINGSINRLLEETENLSLATVINF